MSQESGNGAVFRHPKGFFRPELLQNYYKDFGVFPRENILGEFSPLKPSHTKG
ncbi:hypothetical protein FACS1894127_0620 [Clostridia bacterium]|nr:hypothetical protein FACS1894127_0620 [Clostridia bacterium]